MIYANTQSGTEVVVLGIRPIVKCGVDRDFALRIATISHTQPTNRTATSFSFSRRIPISAPRIKAVALADAVGALD